MNGFRADLVALEDLVGQLSAFERRAADAADRLEAGAVRVQQAWRGPAADAHTAAHRRWVDAHARMLLALGQLRGAARAAQANYTAAAAANARMWR